MNCVLKRLCMKVLNKHGKLNKTFFVGATVSSLTFYKVQQQKYKLTLIS